MATRIIENLILDDDNHTVENWLERLEQAIDIAILNAEDKLPTDADQKAVRINELKRSYLLSSLGPSSYKLLKSYCTPEKPNEKTYDQLVQLLQRKLAPKTNIVSEQYGFNLLKQEASETITLFMARVKEKATRCGFANQYDSMVRNRFICGLRNEKIRTSLLSDCKDDTTSDAVLDKALTKEQANQSNTSMNSVNYVRPTSSNKQSSKQIQNKTSQSHNKPRGAKNNVVCEQCTLKGHSKSECRTRCKYCKTVGHIVKQCAKAKRKRSSQHHVETEQREDGDEDTHYVFRVGEVTGDKGMSHDCMLSTCGCCEPLRIKSSNVNAKALGHGNLVSSQNVDSDLDSSPIENSLIDSIENSSVKIVDNNQFSKPFLEILINGNPLKMELDTGSSLTCISKENFDKLGLENCDISNCNERLCVANYQFETASMKAQVTVEFRGNTWVLPLYVVDCRFPTLLGRGWIAAIFGPNWFDRLISVVGNHQLNSVTQRSHEEFITRVKKSSVFDPGVGEVVGFEASLDLKPDCRPKFCKARPVPFAIKEKIGSTIDDLVSSGMWKPVNHSEYASPIVPIVKEDGTIRICGDYKATVNPNIDTAVYPLPTIEDCLAELVGGDKFTKLDIKQAYNNLRLREDDMKLVTVNTHKGLFAPTRLPYGISSAGAIFQRKMDQILAKMPGVACRVDDIIITAHDDETHMRRVEEVIRRLEAAGFHCRWDKCKFMQPSVVYLGHLISKLGIKPLQCKVETIRKAKYPENVTQLISFLGAVQYYSRYIPHMSTVVEPLNRLRSASTPWRFGDPEKRSFDELKKALSSERVLAFYNPALDLKLDADASSVGLGAVLSQIDEQGREQPVEFISRTLSAAERNYSQIEKEGLAIVWAVKRLHRYLYARPFTLVTDHKPLESIYHPHKSIPEMGISRLQRWALFLSSYQYKVKFRPTQKHSNADMCSRFPLSNKENREETDSLDIGTVHRVTSESESLSSVFSVHHLGDDKPLLDPETIVLHTRRDPVLGKVLYYIKEGWNEKASADSKLAPELKPYFDRRTELSMDSGCVLWGSRVVIPGKLRSDILSLLHSTHMGMSSMKALARGYVWWPNLDSDIESVAHSCEACKINQRMPPASVPHPWVKPSGPWERVHLDFCGPFFNAMWLVVICAYSKWIEVIRMSSTKSGPVIHELRTLFSRFGIPRVIVSDNGPQLVSHEMSDFMARNGVKHILIPSYHPASNGQAESIVGKFKSGMKRMMLKNPDIMCNLANWLMGYRNTPHPATGIEPSMAMMGRRARNALSMLHPLNNSRRHNKLLAHEQKVIEKETVKRQFSVGENVLFWNTHRQSWCRGTIKELLGSKVFLIETDEGQTRKHLDQITKEGHSISEKTAALDSLEPLPTPDRTEPIVVTQGHDHEAAIPVVKHDIESPEPSLTKPSIEKHDLIPPNLPELPRCKLGIRERKGPDRLAYHKLGGENTKNS